MLPLILLCLSVFQTDIPYKAEDEFSVKFVLTFNKREPKSENKNILLEPAQSPVNEPLPFMRVSLDILKKPEHEVRLKIVRNHDDTQLVKKKIKEGMNVIVLTEFVDDIKDRIAGYNHTIYFLNEEGETLSKIVIEFDEEGFYLVNGKKKGKL